MTKSITKVFIFRRLIYRTMLTLWFLYGSMITNEERLHLVVKQRHAPLVREFIKQKPNLDTPECGKVLGLVAEDDDTEIALTLVKSGANLTELRKDILHVLISSGNAKKHKLALSLLERGVDVNFLDERSNRAIFYAVKCESMILVNELLKRNALIDGNTICEAAGKSNAIELLPLLILHKLGDEETKNRRGVHALACLMELKKEEEDIFNSVKTVLNLKLDVNKFDVNCKYGSILTHAIAYNRKSIVELLINNGANIDRKTPLGMYPLHAAVKFHQPSVVKLLLQKGAIFNRHYGIESFMNSKSTQGLYPIHIACQVFCVRSIKLLLSYGADINVLDDKNNTAFSLLKRRISTAHHVMMKHIAILVTRKAAVTISDLKIIDDDVDMFRFYKNCLSELETAKSIKLIRELSLFSVLCKNVKELSYFNRRAYFVEKFQGHISKKSFPMYFSMMKFRLREAVERTNNLACEEQAIYETFQNFLPDIPIERIIFYFYL